MLYEEKCLKLKIFNLSQMETKR